MDMLILDKQYSPNVKSFQNYDFQLQSFHSPENLVLGSKVGCLRAGSLEINKNVITTHQKH